MRFTALPVLLLTLSSGLVIADDDLPGRFLYDPIAGESREFSQTLFPTKFSTGLDAGSSFTIEAFAKPAAMLKTSPRDYLPVFSFGDSSHGMIAGIRRSPAPHSYNWWHARIIQPKQRPIDVNGGGYGGISMVRNDSPWRHLAFCWEAKTKTATFYLDYQLQNQLTLETAPNWNLADVFVGHSPLSKKAFDGDIKNLRVTKECLPAWKFFRATPNKLSNVSFAPEDNPALPADYGHVDVRLHYGAVGDGKHDDTLAIQKAFAENDNRVPIEYKSVYFPAGTYLISGSIRFRRFMVVRGAGSNRTKIVLKDRCEGYQNPEIPKPVFAVGYDWPYANRPKKMKAGNAIGSYIFDLSIDSGHQNPASLGLDFHCNNIGCVENVAIRSGDGAGLVGLDFKRAWPGPCLMKNVSIDGFNYGIEASHREYSLVFSDIRLKNQKVAAIRNNGNVLSLENVISENRLPAVINRAGGLVTMINSTLKGGDGTATAITSENASLYLRDVTVDGYGKSLIEKRPPKDGEKNAPLETIASAEDRVITEYFSGPVESAFLTESEGSLKLPIKPTPAIPRPPVAEWANVSDYQDQVQGNDWAPAIQAAIDSGAKLVYFPDGKYAIETDVTVRGAVRTLFGGSPKCTLRCVAKSDSTDPPALRIADDVPVLQLEMLTPERLIHDTPTTLIVRHCHTGELIGKSGCGELFIEDAGGKWRFNRHQTVWGRQLNPETKGIPEIINDGGTLWMLGLKTEYLSTKIVNKNSARTELLGGLMYPVHPVTDETLPMFINENSEISLVHAVSVYRKNHKIYLKDTQSGETKDVTKWHWVGGRPVMNLYRSSR